MIRIAGVALFWAGVIALVGMLSIDVLDVAQVGEAWFGSLAMILTASMWLTPALRDNFGLKTHG